MSAAAMRALDGIQFERPLDRLLALEMAKLAQDDDAPMFWGMIATLAERLNAPRRTIQRSLARLVKAGCIIRLGIHATYRSVRYLLAFAAPKWRATQAKMAQDVRQNGAHRYNRSKTEEGREKESAHAREAAHQPDFAFQQEGEAQQAKAPAWQPKPAAEQPAYQPEPEPTASAEPQPADLSTWQPDEAGSQFALDKGATDVDAELASFRLYHERRGTPLTQLAAFWRSWCQRIPSYGPNGRRDATRPSKQASTPVCPPTIDGEVLDGTDQPSGNFPEATAVTLPESPADSAGSASWQTDVDAAVARVAALWDLSRRPAGFIDELRDAFARYPAPVLNEAIDQVRHTVKYPTITVADFTQRASNLMFKLQLKNPRFQQAWQREQDAKEAERCAAEAVRKARDKARAEAEARNTAIRVREQRERDAEREAERYLTRHGVSPDQHERMRPVALTWALAKPQYGYSLFQAQICAVMALARHDPDTARELTHLALDARTGQGEDPELPTLSEGLPNDPGRLFQAIMKEA